MAGQQPVQPFELAGFLGGLNREADPYKLNPSESPDAVNVDFGIRGEAKKRLGYIDQWTDAAVSEHIFNFNVDEVVFVRADGSIRYISGGVSTDSTKSLTDSTNVREYPIAHVSLDSALYLTRHINDSPVKWDGTTWSDMTAWDGTDATSVFPQARDAITAHNRVFVGNVRLSGGTQHTSRFYFSDVIDPEGWQALNYFDVSPDDGQEIQALKLFGDQIFIFKDHSIHVVVGTNELEFDVWPMDDKLGTVSPMSVENVGGQLIFFDASKGVYSFDGGGFTRISDKINTYLLDGINDNALEKVRAFEYRNRYYLSVPWGTDTVPSRTFVYDPRVIDPADVGDLEEVGVWMEYDYGIADFTWTPAWGPLGVGVANSQDVKSLFNGFTDDGANIAANVKTAWLSPASPSYKHRARRMDVTLSALGNYDVTLKMYEDFSPSASVIKTMNTLGAGDVYGTALYGTGTYGTASDQIISRTSGWSGRWRSAQFEFVENTTGTFQINRMIMLYSANYRSRGEAY